MESYRNLLNKQQTELRRVLLSFNQNDKAIQLFIGQHALLHSAEMAQSGSWSFEDEILDDMPDEHIRRIPQKFEHSVAWLFWHMARIEDVTMNMLVAGTPQLLHRDNWLRKMKVIYQDTGNAMSPEDVTNLSANINIESLCKYRLAVGCRTREIVKELQPEELKQKVDPSHLQQVMDEGAVVEAARGLIDYWGGRTIAGLLLMPPTRHNIVHLNEALRLKRRRS